MRKLYVLAALLALPALALSQGRTYLVAVGIADYPGTRNDLRLPVADARTMADLYRLNRDAVTVLLTDSAATRQAIVQQMETLFARATGDDIVVLFFSGHGSRGGFAAYDGVLRYAAIREAFAASACRNKMIFADACFSGKLRDRKAPDAEGASPRRDLNVMLFLSSRDDETSIERRNMKNGFFTACLARSLRGGADADGDRVITAHELFDAVSRGVRQLSADRQHPVMWGRFDDDMPVMRW